MATKKKTTPSKSKSKKITKKVIIKKTSNIKPAGKKTTKQNNKKTASKKTALTKKPKKKPKNTKQLKPKISVEKKSDTKKNADKNKSTKTNLKNDKKVVAAKSVQIIKAVPKTTKIKDKNIMPTKLAKKQGLSKRIDLPNGYKPKLDEEYMNASQLEYFRRKLEDWKKDLLLESTETLDHLKTESWNEPDPSDQATIVEQTGLELRTRDRYRKLISKIDAAINRIEIGEYGYCEVTGDPIGIARLEARPIATMTIAAQEQHEMEEKLNFES
jgi:DnaK suppressor protein